MAIIYTYPKVTPALGDLVVITDVSDSNKTKQTTIQNIKDVIDVVDSLTAGPGISLSASTGNITISNTGVLSVDTTNGSFIDLTPVAPTTGNVVITADLSAAGTADSTTFLRGDNVWAPVTSSGASEVVETVRNTSGVDINKGVALHITGNTAGIPDVTYATSDGNYPASGLALSDIPNNSTGQMILLGIIDTIDTTAITGTGGLGDTIYIKEAPGVIPNPFTISDSLTFDAPTGGVYSPTENKLQNVGILVRDNATQGEIQVTAGGRVAATPNLDRGSLFVGNATNQSSELQIGSTGEILTVDASGDAVWAAAPAGYTGWDIDGDTNPGGTITIGSGDSVDIAGGTVIDTALTSGPNTLTVNHSSVSRTNTTATATPSFGSTVSTISQITTSTEGHVTNVERLDITFPANPVQSAVDWNDNLALIGARQANTTTTGANVVWAQGNFTSNQAQYKLIGDYCYLEFDLQFTAVTGWGITTTPLSQYMLVNLPFNAAQPTELEQGFGIVTESLGSFAGYTLVTTTIDGERPVDIIEYQDPKRGDRGVVNYWSAPPATLTTLGGPLPVWVDDTFNGVNTNYMCFTYPNFFGGNIDLTPHYALKDGADCRLRGNIIYRVNFETPTITPPDGNYASD
jgi:hypothetical protein